MAKKHKNTKHETSHLTSDNSASFQEVSFDVLENVVEEKNKKSGYKSNNFSGRAIISSDEVLPQKKGIFKKNKDNKKSESKSGKLAVTVIVTIIMFGAVTGVLSYLQNSGFFYHPEESVELKNAIYKISETDDYIIALNEVLENPINEHVINGAKVDYDDLEYAKSELESLDEEISEIATTLDGDSIDSYYVGCAHQTIESRIMMIDTGLKIYEKAKDSVTVINKTESFFQSVVKADMNLKESDNLVESNDISNYQLAKTKSEEAIKLLNDAKPQIQPLSLMTNAVDFNSYTSYIDVKIQSAQLSVEACQALIDQDIQKIASTNIAYIEKSNQASELARSVSSTPVQLIRTNYDLETRPLIDEFKAARRNAADNDYVLRGYLYS